MAPSSAAGARHTAHLWSECKINEYWSEPSIRASRASCPSRTLLGGKKHGPSLPELAHGSRAPQHREGKVVNPTFICFSPNALRPLSLGNFSSGPTERRAKERRVMMGEVGKQMHPTSAQGKGRPVWGLTFRSGSGHRRSCATVLPLQTRHF